MSALKGALSKTNGISLEDFALYYDDCKIQDRDTPESVMMFFPLCYYSSLGLLADWVSLSFFLVGDEVSR